MDICTVRYWDYKFKFSESGYLNQAVKTIWTFHFENALACQSAAQMGKIVTLTNWWGKNLVTLSLWANL